MKLSGAAMETDLKTAILFAKLRVKSEEQQKEANAQTYTLLQSLAGYSESAAKEALS